MFPNLKNIQSGFLLCIPKECIACVWREMGVPMPLGCPPYGVVAGTFALPSNFFHSGFLPVQHEGHLLLIVFLAFFSSC